MSALWDINSEWQDIVTFAWKKSEKILSFSSETEFFFLSELLKIKSES